MTSSLLTILGQHIAAAEQAVMASTGGAAWCQLQRDGRVTGGVKYDEGRLAALLAVRRRLRAVAPEIWSQELTQELTQWQQALAEVQAQPQPSMPWLAYRQGGVDALTAVIAEAHSTEHPA